MGIAWVYRGHCNTQCMKTGVSEQFSGPQTDQNCPTLAKNCPKLFPKLPKTDSKLGVCYKVRGRPTV